MSTRLVATLDEHARSELEDWLAEFEGDPDLSSQAYLESLKRVLFTIAAHGNAVVVGRGSNFLLPQDKGSVSASSLHWILRIKNTMKEFGLSEKDARKHISKQEAEHRRLVKKNFQADIRDSTRFHLVINTVLVTPDTIVGMVKALIAHNESVPLNAR